MNEQGLMENSDYNGTSPMQGRDDMNEVRQNVVLLDRRLLRLSR